MTQLEKAREEIRILSDWKSARKIVFENRVAIYCEYCDSTGEIITPFGSIERCLNCKSPARVLTALKQP